MKLARTIFGFATVILIAAGLNLLVFRDTLFVPEVLVPIGAGLAGGAVWLALRLMTAAVTSEWATYRGLNTVIGSFVFLAICITAYAFVKRWDVSWDLTREGRRDLAPQTFQVLEGLKEDVEVTCFFVRAGDARVDLAQDKTRRFLERCQRYTDRLKVEFVDPQTHPERLERLNAVRAQAEVKVSGVGTVVMKCGTRQREIPLSDVTSRLEERDFTNALINVSRESRPKVYFLTGHKERDILNTDPKTGGSTFRAWLDKEAYQVERHLIAITAPHVPDDCALLVVNGYESDFNVKEIEALDEYVDRGGRLLVLTDPQYLQNVGANVQEQFRPWLERRFGVRVGYDILVSSVTKQLKIMFISNFNDLNILGNYAGMTQRDAEFRGSFNNRHPITRGMDMSMVLSLVRTVDLAETLPKGAVGTVLLRSTPDTWAETNLARFQADSYVNPDPEDPVGPNPAAVAVSVPSSRSVADDERTREARIVVMGDSDLASNEGITAAANAAFILNCVAWLTENEELIAIRPTGEEDPPVILTRPEQQFIAWLASLGTAQFIALAGLVAFVARRRYR